ncbi:MAG: hypothetical protein E4G89_05580 [Methanothrix sp.]|nr:MAG: hypothetical protein E4G89_05580 [Methanothrix sp.]
MKDLSLSSMHTDPTVFHGRRGCQGLISRQATGIIVGLMSDVLVNIYKTRMESPDCHPGSTSFNMFISIEDDISDLLPYLNAELRGELDYRHKDRILLWTGNGKRHAFRSHEIAVSPFQDDENAEGYAADLVARMNDIWRRRADLAPSEKGVDPLPTAMDIWKLLPRTNCKKCGFPTCMAYAVALRVDPSRLADCEHLSEEAFKKTLPSE